MAENNAKEAGMTTESMTRWLVFRSEQTCPPFTINRWHGFKVAWLANALLLSRLTRRKIAFSCSGRGNETFPPMPFWPAFPTFFDPRLSPDARASLLLDLGADQPE
jgi:hypothetical protein